MQPIKFLAFFAFLAVFALAVQAAENVEPQVQQPADGLRQKRFPFPYYGLGYSGLTYPAITYGAAVPVAKAIYPAVPAVSYSAALPVAPAAAITHVAAPVAAAPIAAAYHYY